MNQRRIALISHTDLDGLGCVMVYKKASRYLNFELSDIKRVDYENIESTLIDIITDGKCNEIHITDLSPSKEVYENILVPWMDAGNKVRITDHHVTSEWMKELDHPNLSVSHGKACGTKLTYLDFSDAIMIHAGVRESDFKSERIMGMYIFDFVDHVNDYDLWKHEYSDSKDLNQLSLLLDTEEFEIVSNARERFLSGKDVNLDKVLTAFIDSATKEKLNYIENTLKGIEIVEHLFAENPETPPKVYKVGEVFCERYASQIGSEAFTRFPEIDFVMLINMNMGTISLRANGKVDVSKIAKSYGGGGHKNAAGFKMKK